MNINVRQKMKVMERSFLTDVFAVSHYISHYLII